MKKHYMVSKNILIIGAQKGISLSVCLVIKYYLIILHHQPKTEFLVNPSSYKPTIPATPVHT